MPKTCAARATRIQTTVSISQLGTALGPFSGKRNHLCQNSEHGVQRASGSRIRGGAGAERGTNRPEKIFVSTQGYQRSTWAGNPSDVYDTTRAASLGSSSGSGVSVSANLATCSLCEETSMSCRGPSNHNAVALILPHKSLISFLGGAIGADIYLDRAGIMCRTVKDAAKVLDALKDPANGYYDPRDIFTTVQISVLDKPYAASAVWGTSASLPMRIGIIRNRALSRAKAEPNSQAARRLKAILGDYLDTLVESRSSGRRSQHRKHEAVVYASSAQLVPVFFPDILYRLTRDGQPQFPEFAAKIKPPEFTRENARIWPMKPIDYFLDLAEGRVPIPKNLNIRASRRRLNPTRSRFHFNQYANCGKDCMRQIEACRFPALNARSEFWGNDQRATLKNWEEWTTAQRLGERRGSTSTS